MPKWDFNQASDDYFYWGKVHKSFVGPASEEYQKAANGRAPDQWHVEVQRLGVEYDDGTPVIRKNSMNLPRAGENPRMSSPLMGAIAAYNMSGFTIESEEDFPKIEGHTFYFVNQEREFGEGRRASKKTYDWPITCEDSYEPDEVVIIAKDGGGEVDDPYKVAAEALNGKGLKQIIPALASNNKLSDNATIMTLAQTGKLIEQLEARKLVKVIDGKIQKE